MPSIISEYISKNMSILDLKKELSRLRLEYNKQGITYLFMRQISIKLGKGLT